MESGCSSLVADLHGRTELDQFVDGLPFCRADVRSGDDPEGASQEKLADGVGEKPEALPLDKGAKQVHPVGGGDLGGQLLVKGGFAPGVDKQVSAAQRILGARRLRADGEQYPWTVGDEVAVVGTSGLLDEAAEKSVGDTKAALIGQRVEDSGDDLLEVGGQKFRGLRLVNRLRAGFESGLAEQRVESGGDQFVVGPARQPLHKGDAIGGMLGRFRSETDVRSPRSPWRVEEMPEHPNAADASIGGMTVWFTADLHLGHANIIDYSDRPFADADCMNRALVEGWNETVDAGDDVWVLGDFALGKIADTLPMVAELRGRKILLAGNHDRCWAGHRGPATWTERYIAAGFAEVHQGTVRLRIGERSVGACHFPYQGDSHDNDRFSEYRPADNGNWLLHGHVHDLWRQRGRMINVGVDAWGYRPVSEAVLSDLVSQGPADRHAA